MSRKMILTLAFLLSATGAIDAQQATSQPARIQVRDALTTSRPVPGYLPGASQWSQALNPFAQGASTPEQKDEIKRRRNIQVNVRTAMAALKNSDGESREDAKQDLQKALGEEYDMLLADYDKNLDRLAKQLAEMQEKLNRRKAAKDDMIRLRLQVLEAQADDLGWPGQSNGTFPTRAFGFNSNHNHFGNMPTLTIPGQSNTQTSIFRSNIRQPNSTSSSK